MKLSRGGRESLAENRQFTATPKQYLELGKKLREGSSNLNTAEALEKITDRGKFELLVTSVLRKHNRDYAAIIHTGINAQGETIKSPVDGFCRVPGSVPPRFLFVQHATTDRNQLEKKWLHDHTTVKPRKNNKKTQPSESDDGDLLKAGQEAKKIKTKFPDAQCTVILATNQHLPQGIDLITKVEEKATTLGVDVDIWEQSKIADFLDSTPEGQWLRKEYIGVNAEMLSESLLGDLCKQSLANYQKEYIPSSDSLVPREIDIKVEKGTYSNTYTIQLLIGESGSGKSVAAYQLLKKYIESGGYGLWVSDSVANGCDSLQNLLDRVLQNLYPSLLPGAGSSVLQFIPERSRLLLIVDDVNRTDNPTRLVQKLINWFKPQQSGTSDSKPVFSPYLLVCPVWSKVSSPISLDFKEKPWINPVFINSMNSEEGMAAIQSVTSLAGREITNTEAASLAKKLGNDPILIGLFYELLLSNAQQYELERFTENVIEQFITTTLSESSNSGTFLENEYRASLSTVATQMLKSRKWNPLWTDIEEWLRESSDKLTALRELIKHKALCRLTQENKFVFRHDRIRETLLVESMIKLLADTTPDSDILYEPFYAEIIGQAIARSPQSQEFFRELRNRLPLALVEAIRCFGTPTTESHQEIIEEVKKWVNRSVAIDSIPESILNAVCRSLLETNSLVLLEITEKFPQLPLVLLARFRNGCVVSGVRFCTYWSRFDFVPALKDNLFYQIIEQAKRYYGGKLLKELKQLLTNCDFTDEERRGALVLAGFLGFTDLQDEIKTCWTLATDKTQVLSEAIWAAFQGSVTKYGKLLDELMAYWNSLPDDQYGYGDSPKAIVTANLTSALRYGTSDEVISYLIAQSDIHKSLHQDINYILRHIDAPDAIEFVVRSATVVEIRNFPDRLARATTMLSTQWNSGFPDSPRLSQASINRLKYLWKEPKNDDFLKEIAFHVWQIGIEHDEINTLKEIPSNSPLYPRALLKRAELEDRSVVPSILPLLSEKDYGFSVAHYVWCDEIMLEVKRYLNTFKNSISADFSSRGLYEHRLVSWLLTRIPGNDAETLLDECWSYLGYSPLFIQTALYVGTPKCLELVADSIKKCPDSVSVFKHFSSHFRLNDTNNKKYLTAEHLRKIVKNILPYLERIDEFELWQLAEACNRFEIPQWNQQDILPRLTDEFRRRCHLFEDDLFNELEPFAISPEGIQKLNLPWTTLTIDNQTYSSFDSFKDKLPEQVKPFANTLEGVRKLTFTWLQTFNTQHHLILNVVKRILASHRTTRSLQITAVCIEVIGTRKDLSILDQYTIEGSHDEIARIKESTRFAVYRRSLD